MSLRRFAAICVALFAVACGGEDKGRPDVAPPLPGQDPLPPGCRPLILPVNAAPDPGSGPVDCRGLEGYEVYLLDDFEQPGSNAWYFNSDRTAVTDPVPDTGPPNTSEIPNGRCTSPDEPTFARCASPDTPPGECDEGQSLASRRALRITSGLLTSNGGQFGRSFSKTCDPTVPACTMKPGPPEIGPCAALDTGVPPNSLVMGPSPPIAGCRGSDFSTWEGVVLWGRKAPGSTASVRVRVADGRTDDAGCVCNSYTNQNDSSDGCDKFGQFVTFNETFHLFLVPFDQMQQGGWGKPSPGLDRSDLFSLAVDFGRGAWDIWVDDIGFYRRKP